MVEEIIWVFHGAGGRFASGVFQSQELAEEWIFKYKLEGTLTKYPVNIGVYDWANEQEYFNPFKAEHQKAEFIQQFTTASQEHYHFENDDAS